MESLLSALTWAWEWLEPIAAFIATFGLTISVMVGAAWAAFQWFGQRWIENKFAQALEQYRAGQAQELERLKHKINSSFDRITRLHDREFEVLPDLWGKLVEARLWAVAYVSPMQSYPDIDRLEDDALAEFLEDRPFSQWQKREIMEAPDRQAKFIKIHDRYRHADVVDKIRAFDMSFSKNGIFLNPALEEMMRNLIDMVHHAVVEHSFNEEHDVKPRRRVETAKLEVEGAELHLQIKKAVTDRLWESARKEV